MSQEFMDPELFADFIVEAKEHLETIEPNLLELEKNPENLGLLNQIFRPMHSLKGASGFLGLNAINELAHKAEYILDELRKGNITVTAEIMDVILAATDALRTMIDNLETTNTEGDVDTAPIIARIDAILEGGGAAPAPASVVLGHDTQDEPLAQAAGDDDEAPAAAQAFARQDDGGFDDQARVGKPPQEPNGPAYALTSIGEGHMADFLEEAKEIIDNLNTSLLSVENDESGGQETINDIFRFFHNLKGNSGIIGHKEINSVTHEAETLLNFMRKGEIKASHALIDLLLAVVDTIETLLGGIDAEKSTALPYDIEGVTSRLQQVCANGGLPDENGARPASGQTREAQASPSEPAQSEEPAAAPAQEEQAPAPEPAQACDPDDLQVFEQTVDQQFQNIFLALALLKREPENKDFADGLYRSFSSLSHASNFMGFGELKTLAERTGGLVDQARKADLSFDMMVDILSQETSILRDETRKTLLAVKPGSELAASLGGPVDEAEFDRLAELTLQRIKAEKAEAEAKAAAPEQSGTEAAAPAQAAVVAEQAAPAAPATETPAQPAPQAETAPKAASAPVAPTPAAEKAAPKPPAAPAEKPAAPAVKPAAKPVPAATEAKPAPAKPAAPVAQPATQAAAKPAAQPDAGSASKVSSTIRVDHEKLDHLMNLIGELIINRNRYSLLARSLEEGKLDIAHIAQSLTETTYAMARISDDLQDTIMKVRMVPVSSVFSRFPRLVRDLSRKSGKEVNLITEGEETELDKSVVEVIGDPLVHLIRNSVDHGLETEDERRAAGKPPVGRVWLRAYHKGNSVAIEIEDDGRGIDPEKMRHVAVKKGLMTMEEAKQMDDRDAIEIIFMPGFSSAEKVTDISGRGVGMDVVRTNIKNLKGTINTTSEVGKGTKFTLMLPLTLAIIDALMVVVDGATFAIPLDSVSETTKIEVARMTEVNKRKAVQLRGEVLGIVELRELLQMPPKQDEREIVPVVIIQDHERRLGVIVDRLLERQEVVIKPLGSYLNDFDLRGISGATIMGDGSVVLILDPHEVYLMSTAVKSGKEH